MDKRKEYPMVTIIIATFNSGKQLPRTLEALREQSYPQEKIEILIVDGGSNDDTYDVALKYGCKVIYNDKTEPVNAKRLGFLAAEGKYIVTLDHDEQIENADSIKKKVEALEEHPECKVAFCSGYKRPSDYPALNQYISDFGDPFSLFIYNFPKDYLFLEKTLRRNCRILIENNEYFEVSFDNMRKTPIIELVCLGTMVNRKYFTKLINLDEGSKDFVQAFYCMLNDGVSECIFIKNDPLVHYSADSLKAYFPKLKWRICNNVHFSDMASSGFEGRLKYQRNIKYKKYCFIPYVISTIAPLGHGITLAVARKNGIYIMHAIFCWYVLIQILYQYTLKLLGKVPQKMSYDGKKKIDEK